MNRSRRIVPASAVIALLLVSCGGSGSDDPVISADTAVTTDSVPAEDFTPADDTIGDTAADTQATDAPATDPAVTDTEADTEADDTTAPVTADATVATGPADGGSVSAAAGGAAVSLVEWEIDAPTEYVAGDVTFTATNNGNFPHELVVIQGEGYESLPLAEGGSVIEDDLPTGALIARTPRIGGGSSEDLTVTLAPGNYVLVCNLGGGGNSHAGRGQRLDITVS